MKICHIIGTRPQFIKYFALSNVIKTREQGRISEVLINTGQHYDYNMSDLFFEEFEIATPDYHLGVGSNHHGRQTADIIVRVEKVLLDEKPDVVLVYGDTNSTLGGAIASAKLNIAVAHIEAGLRSFNRSMPEEINRVVTDHVSKILFCPGRASVENLLKEGFKAVFDEGRLISVEDLTRSLKDLDTGGDSPIVINTGDVMYDLFMHFRERKSDIVESLCLKEKEYAVLTIHRAENIHSSQRMNRIVDFVNRMSERFEIIFPIHPRAREIFIGKNRRLSKRIRIVEPLSYFDFQTLLSRAVMVLTDSGGVQKEAFWLRVPCVTIREETEWIETVESGWNVLYRDYSGEHKPEDTDFSVYGDGSAAERIAAVLEFLF